MLAKRKPSLIAIDEAHCISQWGMISADYRMLAYLPSCASAVIALTATATRSFRTILENNWGSHIRNGLFMVSTIEYRIEAVEIALQSERNSPVNYCSMPA